MLIPKAFGPADRRDWKRSVRYASDSNAPFQKATPLGSLKEPRGTVAKPMDRSGKGIVILRESALVETRSVTYDDVYHVQADENYIDIGKKEIENRIDAIAACTGVCGK